MGWAGSRNSAKSGEILSHTLGNEDQGLLENPGQGHSGSKTTCKRVAMPRLRSSEAEVTTIRGLGIRPETKKAD